MAITVDWPSRVVDSTASITDIVAFKEALRDLEDDPLGMMYPPVITYKRLDLGGGAFQHGVDFINGYVLRFPVAGNYTITGNINATIQPVAGVFVDRTKASAFATVAGDGGSAGPTAAEIAAAVLAAMNTTPPGVNVLKMNSATVIGVGAEADPWRGVGVSP